MSMSARPWIRVAYPSAAWFGWVAWAVGMPLGRAVIVTIAVGLVVMLPWAVRREISSTIAPPSAVLGNSPSGRS